MKRLATASEGMEFILRYKQSIFVGLTLCIIGIILGAAAVRLRWVVFPGVSTTYIQVQNQNSWKDAPLFTLPDASNQKVQLKDFRGSVIILHFWASWCAPCLEEIPHWVELGTLFRNRPIKLIAVSLDQNWAEAQKILPSKNLSTNIISLLDSEGKLPDQYGTYQYPETYLLSPDLKIVLKWVGPQDWTGSHIQGIIEKLLKGSLSGEPSSKE